MADVQQLADSADPFEGDATEGDVARAHSVREDLIELTGRLSRDVQAVEAALRRRDEEEAAALERARQTYRVVKIERGSPRQLRLSRDMSKRGVKKPRNTFYMCSGGQGHHLGICPHGNFRPHHDRSKVAKHIQIQHLTSQRERQVREYGEIAT